MNTFRHTRANKRNWNELEARVERAAEDGVFTLVELDDIRAAIHDGKRRSDVMEAGESLELAVRRATDPEYIGGLTQIYLAKCGQLPAA